MRWNLLTIVSLSLCFAGSAPAMNDEEYLAAMGTEHANDEPVASGSIEEGPAVQVEGAEVAYGTVDGREITGYLSRPADAEGPLPGIIVIHEWWGLNDNIRRMADKLAGEGFQALAVDLYGGEIADEPEGARKLAGKAMENRKAGRENLRQAYAYLDDEMGAPRVGVIGWCFGGGWSLQTALMLPESIDATVIYYGRPVTDAEELAQLDMPVIGFFGEKDQGIPPEDAQAFEQTLEEAGVNAEIHIYPGAGHAFANPSGNRYQKEAAEDAWGRTLKFFEKHLKEANAGFPPK